MRTGRLWKVRITKCEWYRLGGFKNSGLFRTQASRGGWQYWMRMD